MKQVAGHGELEDTVKRIPTLKEKGLTPYQGLLHAIWSDERISSCCVSMRNTDQITENSVAANKFTAMNQAEIEQLRDACLAFGADLLRPTAMAVVPAAGTEASLGDLTRLLTYHDQYGYRQRSQAALWPDVGTRPQLGGGRPSPRPIRPVRTGSISLPSCPGSIRNLADPRRAAEFLEVLRRPGTFRAVCVTRPRTSDSGCEGDFPCVLECVDILPSGAK